MNKKLLITVISASMLGACSGRTRLDLSGFETAEGNSVVVSGEQAVGQFFGTIRHSRDAMNDGLITQKADFSQAQHVELIRKTIEQRPESKTFGSVFLDSVYKAQSAVVGTASKMLPAATKKKQ